MSKATIATAPRQMQARDGAPAKPLPERIVSVATLAGAAAALLLLAWVALGTAVSSRSPGAANGQIAARSAQTIEPLLIVQPRTVTQAVRVDGLRLMLAAHPVLPGPNRFVVALADHGRPIARARVRILATMPGMLMRPLVVRLAERRDGRYVAAAALPMLGRWQLVVVAERDHVAPVQGVFVLDLDFSPALLAAIGAHDRANH